MGVRNQDLIRRLRDAVLRELNRQIDRTYHPYFDDPDKCLQAVFLDTYAHQIVESILGIPPKEIAKRTKRYFPRAFERCLNAIIREAAR